TATHRTRAINRRAILCHVASEIPSALGHIPNRAYKLRKFRESRTGGNMSIRPRLCSALIATLLIAPSVQASLAQAPTNIVRTVLAVTSLPSVGNAPLFFRLSRVELPPGQTTTYSGPVGFLYALSGALTVQTNAGQQSLQQDDAVLEADNDTYSLKSSPTEPASFLHFVLGRSTELDQAAEHAPALVREIYRSPQAIPDLKPGRYEFTLTRVSYPRM